MEPRFPDPVRIVDADGNALKINPDGSIDVVGGGGGGGTVDSVVAGSGIAVDDTDPANPIVSASPVLSATTQADSYTLALADQGTVVEMTKATASTLTVPPNSDVAFDVGVVIEILQYGAGQVTIAPGAGVTLRSVSGNLKIAAQYASATLRKRATNEWVVQGSMVA